MLLLEPPEFLQSAMQLTQVLGGRPIICLVGLVPQSRMGWSYHRDVEDNMRRPAECSRHKSIEGPLGELSMVIWAANWPGVEEEPRIVAGNVHMRGLWDLPTAVEDPSLGCWCSLDSRETMPN